MLIVAIRQRPAICERTSSVDELVRGLGEALGQRGPGAERLAEQHAADREALLDLRLHVGQAPLALRR